MTNLDRFCVGEASAAAEQLNQKIKYHNLTDINVVKLLPPTKKASEKAGEITYGIQATLERNQSVIESETRRAGRFMLATNVLNVNELSNDEMLYEYKAQQSAERGFG